MTLEIFSILFFIPCTWSIRLYVDERGVSDLSSLAGGRKYLTYAHSRWVSTDYSLYCPSEPECVCNQERDGYVLHCEKEVHASMTPVEAKNGKLDLQCDVTLPSDGLRHDYYLTLGLEEFEEEIRLANNSISTIFMDWRNMLVNLRILDLRYNKIKYLTHQDMLFSTTILHTDGRREPMKCFHSLQVDLRHNLIAGMELPNNMLVKRRKGKCFANVTMMLEDNPFNCGCDVIKVLRLFDGDVVLTSELQRSEGVNWILPAKIEPGNLSCWTPETVRGKRITDTETWMHHIIPTLGVCSLIDDF